MPDNCACDEEPVRNVSPEKPVYGDYSKEVMGESGKDQPPYLPRYLDDVPEISGKGHSAEMGPIGPWATGRIDWGPLSGMTGTRPIVDTYTISRFSPSDWRRHNKDVLCSAVETQYKSNMGEMQTRQALKSIASSSDQKQHNSTVRLGVCAHNIHRWKCEIEQSITDTAFEIDMLESERRRARQAKYVLELVKSVSTECIKRRVMRLDSDLVRDFVEEELTRECALVKEVIDLVTRFITQIEEQQDRNKAIKSRLESDWSDKKESLEIESINIGLNNKSPLIQFKPGATRIPDSQSTPEGWENNNRSILQVGEATRAKSCELRQLFHRSLTDAIRDIRAQSDRVDSEFAKRIAEMDLCRLALEHELLVVVGRIAKTENLIIEIKSAIRHIDYPLKVTQTRLDNRLIRPRIENCRDDVQYGLLDEVKSTAENSSTLRDRLNEAERSLAELRTTRGILEREIQIKLKSLEIDRERCRDVRAQYPSVTAMSGL